MYMIQLRTDQQEVSVDPIEIVDDFFAEENETFLISLSPGPDRNLFNYQIDNTKDLVTVIITDNDSKSCHNIYVIYDLISHLCPH